MKNAAKYEEVGSEIYRKNLKTGKLELKPHIKTRVARSRDAARYSRYGI